MSQIFRNHLEKFIKINDDDFEKIFSYFEVKTFAKKKTSWKKHRSAGTITSF